MNLTYIYRQEVEGPAPTGQSASPREPLLPTGLIYLHGPWFASWIPRKDQKFDESK
jgi:hypothetical protein